MVLQNSGQGHEASLSPLELQSELQRIDHDKAMSIHIGLDLLNEDHIFVNRNSYETSRRE